MKAVGATLSRARETDPAVLRRGHLQVEPPRVGGSISSSACRSRMPASTTFPPGLVNARQHRREQLERIGQDVGQHDVIGPGGTVSGAGRHGSRPRWPRHFRAWPGLHSDRCPRRSPRRRPAVSRRSREHRCRSRSPAPTAPHANSRPANAGTARWSDALRCRMRGPGSSLRLIAGGSGGSHHDGTIHRRVWRSGRAELLLARSHPVLLRHWRNGQLARASALPELAPQHGVPLRRSARRTTR